MVRLTGGKYFLGAPLRIGDKTHLQLDQDVTLVRNFAGGAITQATIVNADGANGNANIRVSGGTITTEGASDSFIGKHLGFNNVATLTVDNVRFPRVWRGWTAYFRDCRDVLISNLEIGDGIASDDQLTDDGLHFSGGTRIAIVNCNIFCGDDCIALTHENFPDGLNQTDLTFFTASNCTLTSSRANAVRILIGGQFTGVKAIRQVRISNVVAKVGVGLGDDVTSAGIRIEDLSTDATRRISDIALDGVTLDASQNSTGVGNPLVVKRADRVQLTGMRIDRPAKWSTIDGANDVELRDCSIDAPRLAGHGCLQVANAADCTNIRVLGGMYRGAKSHGIQLGGTGTVNVFQVCAAFIDAAQIYGLLISKGVDGLASDNFIRNCGDRGIYELAPSDRNLFLGNFLQGIGINTAVQYQGASTEAVRNIAVGKDVQDSGGFRQTIDGFNQNPVPASQSNVELLRATGRFRAARKGSVTGLVVTSSKDCTFGSLTVEVYRNTGLAGAAGGGIGLTATLTNISGETRRKAQTQRQDADTFEAGDELYIVVSTSVDWAPTDGAIYCALEIED
ncbi:MAG: hypothetical protein KF847_20130 [Pirellulales bacterium]|nr:hypothetical protein [Pirellulales bacterium]